MQLCWWNIHSVLCEVLGFVIPKSCLVLYLRYLNRTGHIGDKYFYWLLGKRPRLRSGSRLTVTNIPLMSIMNSWDVFHKKLILFFMLLPYSCHPKALDTE